MLKLKLQSFDHLMGRTDPFEKTLMLGKTEGRRKGQQRMRWLDGITNSVDRSLRKLWSWWWTGRSGVLQSTGLQRVGHDWVTDLNWTDDYWICDKGMFSFVRNCYTVFVSAFPPATNEHLSLTFEQTAATFPLSLPYPVTFVRIS